MNKCIKVFLFTCFAYLAVINNSVAQVATGKLYNRSATACSKYQVVVLDTAHDNSFIKTTTERDANVLGIVWDTTINVAATGAVQIAPGVSIVSITGTVTRGDYLITSTTAGKAKSGGTTDSENAFGIALEGGTDTNIDCFLVPFNTFPATINVDTELNVSSGYGDSGVTIGDGGTISADGLITAAADILLLDDQDLKFGTDSDIQIRYDETTDDRLEIGDGTNLFLWLKDLGTTARLGLTDDSILAYGTDMDIQVTYDAATDNRLEWSDGTNLLAWLTDAGTTGTFGTTGSIVTTGALIEDTDNEDLVLRTNSNANQLVLDSEGHVGIGTASPSSMLHIYSSENTINQLQHPSYGLIAFKFPSTRKFQVYSSSASDYTLEFTNGSTGYLNAIFENLVEVGNDLDVKGGDIQNSAGTTLTTPEEWHITAAEGCFADKYNPQTSDTDTYINFAADRLRLYAGGTLMVDALEGAPDVGTLGGDAWWVTNALNVGGGYGSTGVTVASSGDVSLNGNLIVDGASSNKEVKVTAFTGASTDTLDATGKHTVVLDLAASDTLVNITNGVTGQRLKLINIDAANAPVIDDEGGNIDLPGSNVDITLGGVYDNIELTYITTDTVNKWIKTGGETGY